MFEGFQKNKVSFEDNSFVAPRVCELVVTSESGITATILIKQEGVIIYDNIKAGDKIEFGRFPQSVDADIKDSNTYEPLTWIVDFKDNNEIYMTTEKFIDSVDYNCVSYNNGSNGFPVCNLMDYLKGDFYNKAFNDEERAIIGYFDDSRIDSPVSLFNPSVPYFSTAESRRCMGTDYSVYVRVGGWGILTIGVTIRQTVAGIHILTLMVRLDRTLLIRILFSVVFVQGLS